MNMATDITQFDPTDITFMGIKKNNIINGHFSKIIYGDSIVTFNGIYIYFQIIPNYIMSFIEPDYYDANRGGNKRKNEYSIFYLDTNSTNLNVVHQLSSIEHSIIEYYKSLYKINKTSVYQLKTQLHGGNIKIYKNDIDNNGKLPISGRPTTLHHYYKNIKETETSPNCEETQNYLLKISGIWENKFSLGITYKIIELGNCIK